MFESAFKRKSPLAVAGILIALAALTVFACLNPIGQERMSEAIAIDGVPPEEFFKNFTTHKDRAYWKDVEKQLIDRRNDPVDYSPNNLAVAFAHLRKPKEAIAILRTLEKKVPGEYATATNLGTAYELSGQDVEALRWIKEGIARKSDSHFGSEWLHVKIVETKLRLKDEPNWLASNTVLGADVSSITNSPETKTLVIDHLGQPKTLKQIESALVYQLHERLEFIKPPEPVVADLLTDLSTVFAITRTSEHAQMIHDLAKTYGAIRTPVLKRPEVVKEQVPEERKDGYGFGIVTFLFIGLSVVLVTLFGWRYFARNT